MKLRTIFLVISLIIIFLSCKDKPQISELDTINCCDFKLQSFSPDSGLNGSKVRISGNFPDTNITVLFDSVNAKIESLTSVYIIVIVPNGITGKVHIKVIHKSDTHTFKNPFSIIKNPYPISISSFSPSSGYNGAKVILYGNNFSSNNIYSVAFDDKEAQIEKVTDDSISVFVPQNISGKVKIKLNCQADTLIYKDLFEVLGPAPKIDLKQFNKYSFNFYNINVSHHYHDDYINYPNPTVSSDRYDSLYYYSTGYKNSLFTKIDSISPNEFNLNENFNPDESHVNYNIDLINQKVISLHIFVDRFNDAGLDTKEHKWFIYDITLTDIPFVLNNDSSITINLKCNELKSHLQSFVYESHGTYDFTNTHDKYYDVYYIFGYPDSTSFVFTLSR